MNELNKIEIKSIKKIIGEKAHFFIPRYQRGYRWGDQEITEMLEDISEYQKRKVSKFYCLQPIVVKKRKDVSSWELIDGQQRLTTLYIILSYL